MSYQREHAGQTVPDAPACVHLRSKAMYVTGEFDPSHADETGSHACWCNLTQHAFGPDDAPVRRATCIDGRGCFRTSR